MAGVWPIQVSQYAHGPLAGAETGIEAQPSGLQPASGRHQHRSRRPLGLEHGVPRTAFVSPTNPPYQVNLKSSLSYVVEIDRFFGNPQAWMTSFPFVSPDQGAATHVFAAFDPDISGQIICYL